MKTNKEIVESFLKVEACKNGHMTSTGLKLFSYQTLIGQWVNVGDKSVLIVNLNKYSRTTSAKHQAPLRMLLVNLIKRGEIHIIRVDGFNHYPVTEGITELNQYLPRGVMDIGWYAQEWYDKYMYDLKGGS